jgi:hypothetical protein
MHTGNFNVSLATGSEKRECTPRHGIRKAVWPLVKCTLEPRSTGLWLYKTTNKNGLMTFRGDGIFTWHEAEQCYTLSWFDPMGVLPDILRGSIEKNILTLTSRGPQGQTRTVFDFTGEKRYQCAWRFRRTARCGIPSPKEHTSGRTNS